MRKRNIIILLSFLCLWVLPAYSYYETMKVGGFVFLRISWPVGSVIESDSWSVSGSCIRDGYGTTGTRTIYGVSPGTGYVSCSYRYYTFNSYDHSKVYHSGYDSWTIEVESNDPTSVTIKPETVEIDVGGTASLSADISPYDAEYSYISWASSSPSIATVSNSTGKSATVTGIAAGETTVSATTDNGVKGTCSVKVWGTTPTAVSISGESSVYIGYTKQMTAGFTPTTHHSTVTWSSDKTSVATVNQNGVVTGIGSGTAAIKATTANGLSATKTITVTEPPFTLESTSPNNGETNVTVFLQPSATFSLPLYTGAQVSEIKLYAGSVSNKVAGNVTISGKSVTFVPTRALQPYTTYTFLIPANGVNNQWGTGYSKDVSFSFTTGNVTPMTLKAYLKAGYVEAGELLELEASESDAEIRYTTNGTEPSENSKLYTSPIAINKDVTIWARAYKDGYATPEYKGTYKISHVHVTDKYPEKEPLYIYKDVNPYITFEINMKKGPEYGDLSVVKDDGYDVEGNFILHENRLVFVPKNDLELGHTYTVFLPEGALLSRSGEPNKEIMWSFTTGMFIRSISAGYQHAAAVRTDNALLYWGETINEYDGGDYTDQTLWYEPNQLASDVYDVSCGFMHNLLTRTDEQVYGWGLQFCGEIGAGSLLVEDPVKVSGEKASLIVAGGQNSAILKDGTMKMAGRNDYGQVGKTTQMAYSRFQNVSLSNIKQVALGWETILALEEDGTLYGWGNNAHKLLADGTTKNSESPEQIMTDVNTMAISKWDNTNVAVVKKDGTLWTWGLNDAGQIGDGTNTQPESPIQVMNNVKAVAVGNHFMAAIDTSGALWTWGDNSFGQLGDGSTTKASQPHKVMEEVESIDLGKNFAVALKTDGSMWTWGANDFCQLGNGEISAYNATPKQILPGRERKTAQGVQIMNATLQMVPEDQAVISAKPVPLLADYHEWNWSTSDASVATVDKRGVVTAVALGTAIITLTSDNGETAQCTVSVVKEIDGINNNVSTRSEIFDIYNLQGHEVRSKSTNLKGLPKKIYIINDKKVLVK